MATYSSILAWRIPWTEEPGRLQSMGLQRGGQDLATEHTHTFINKVLKIEGWGQMVGAVDGDLIILFFNFFKHCFPFSLTAEQPATIDRSAFQHKKKNID